MVPWAVGGGGVVGMEQGCTSRCDTSYEGISFTYARSALAVIYVRHAPVLTSARSDFDGSDAAKRRTKVKIQQGRWQANIAVYSVANRCANQTGYHCLAIA